MNAIAMIIEELPREGLAYSVLTDAEALECSLGLQLQDPSVFVYVHDAASAQAALCAALGVDGLTSPSDAVSAWQAAHPKAWIAITLRVTTPADEAFKAWFASLERARWAYSDALCILVAMSPASRNSFNHSVVVEEGTFICGLD